MNYLLPTLYIEHATAESPKKKSKTKLTHLEAAEQFEKEYINFTGVEIHMDSLAKISMPNGWLRIKNQADLNAAMDHERLTDINLSGHNHYRLYGRIRKNNSKYIEIIVASPEPKCIDWTQYYGFIEYDDKSRIYLFRRGEEFIKSALKT